MATELCQKISKLSLCVNLGFAQMLSRDNCCHNGLWLSLTVWGVSVPNIVPSSIYHNTGHWLFVRWPLWWGSSCLVYKCTVSGSEQLGTQLQDVHLYIMVMVIPSCVHPGLSTGESVTTATLCRLAPSSLVQNHPKETEIMLYWEF